MANPVSTKNTHLIHSDRIAAGKGVLLVPSMLAADDLPRLAKLAEGRSLLLLTEKDAAYSNAVQESIKASGIRTVGLHAPEAGPESRRTIADGGIVIFATPTSVARSATTVLVPRASLEALCILGAPLQVVYIDHPRLSRFRVESASKFKDAILCVGNYIPAASVTMGKVWEELLLAGSEAYSSRPTFQGSLARMLVQGIKAFGGTAKVIDGNDGSESSYHRILAAAIVLAKEIKKVTNLSRVGIVLPPGKAALVANLAVVLAGKTPVNLNFTAGKEAVESSIKQGEIDRFLTADVFVRKMQSFPWPPLKQLIFLERLLPSLKNSIIRWLGLIKVLPSSVLCSLIGISKAQGDDEAALLFTSGSSGEPKGVLLSHRNLLSNVHQFGTRLEFSSEDKILACLPLFHSFGCTVTLWYPLIEGISIVTYPSPLESPKLAELIEKHKISLLLSTPTFLRGYLRRVNSDQLASLKLIVTGAEKLPVSLEEEFRKRFGKPVMEGYGLTETSPATNVNLPDPLPQAGQDGQPIIPCRRLGSVGQLLAGIAVKVTDPNTEAPLSVDQSGMIWLRGPNIFQGYLKQPRKTEEVLQGGWFRTGDIGRLDADGFLFIEGRLSRFSKIGGEMIPHETVESHINRALGLEGESERKIAVVGVPDPDKGEALVLLSTVASESFKQELINLRYTLLEQGVPALWIPKRIVPVPAIPILPSGKLDIKGCEKLANLAG